jgi:hypothetical protein
MQKPNCAHTGEQQAYAGNGKDSFPSDPAIVHAAVPQTNITIS